MILWMAFLSVATLLVVFVAVGWRRTVLNLYVLERASHKDSEFISVRIDQNDFLFLRQQGEVKYLDALDEPPLKLSKETKPNSEEALVHQHQIQKKA